MNYNFATHNVYLISIWGLGLGSLPYFREEKKARRAENVSGTEQNSSRTDAIFTSTAGRQNEPFSSRIYPNLSCTEVNKPAL